MSKKESNPVGRPLKYTSNEQVKEIIDQYFSEVGDAYIGNGDDKRYIPTMSGLAYALDLSRQGLLDYSHKAEFYDTIKKARLKVEISLEQRLAGSSPVGTIFNLKNNFNWKDRTEHDVTNRVTYKELVKRFDGSIDESED